MKHDTAFVVGNEGQNDPSVSNFHSALDAESKADPVTQKVDTCCAECDSTCAERKARTAVAGRTNSQAGLNLTRSAS